MARENYTLFNLDGPTQYIDKMEKGYPVVEVHEFCCNSNETHNINVMSEGHIYNKNTQEPEVLIRNFSFFCEQHHPNNF